MPKFSSDPANFIKIMLLIYIKYNIFQLSIALSPKQRPHQHHLIQQLKNLKLYMKIVKQLEELNVNYPLFTKGGLMRPVQHLMEMLLGV